MDDETGEETNEEGITRRESVLALPMSLLDMERSLDGLSSYRERETNKILMHQSLFCLFLYKTQWFIL